MGLKLLEVLKFMKMVEKLMGMRVVIGKRL